MNSSTKFHWKTGKKTSYKLIFAALGLLLNHFRYWIVSLLIGLWILGAVQYQSMSQSTSNIAELIVIILGTYFACMLLFVWKTRLTRDFVTISETGLTAQQGDNWHEARWDDIQRCELTAEASGQATLTVCYAQGEQAGRLDSIPIPATIDIEEMAEFVALMQS